MIYSPNFPEKEKDERIILTIRRHWFYMAKRIIFILFIAFVPFFIYWGLNNILGVSFEKDSLIFIAGILAASLYYLVLVLFLYHEWVDYYLDVWILTDRRIVSILQQGIFSRTVSEVKIYRLQDATSEIRGKLATFLRYGNVYVQSAGTAPRFIFDQIPHPEKVVRKIHEIHTQWLKKHGSFSPISRIDSEEV